MCTVSWLHEDGGYQIFCNRDEKISRARALAPRIVHREGVQFAAPVDGESGGTWIGANEFGVALCLLNGSPPVTRRRIAPRKSRGTLVTGLLTASCLEEVYLRLARLDLSPYGPFTLAAFEPARHTGVAAWDGEEIVILPYGEPYMPLTSSSFDSDGVQSARREELFRRIRTAGTRDARVLEGFHKSHGGRPSAYSTCMHRPDAETVSFTRLRVMDTEVGLRYTPSAPCKGSARRTVRLACRSWS